MYKETPDRRIIKPRLTAVCLLVLGLTMLFCDARGQQRTADSVLREATLERVVHYALIHQPAVQQAELDEDITNKVIRGKLADWLPQIGTTLNYQRFLDLQKTVFNGTVIPIGVENTSFIQFGATQTLFNRDVLLAARSACSNSRARVSRSTELPTERWSTSSRPR